MSTAVKISIDNTRRWLSPQEQLGTRGIDEMDKRTKIKKKKKERKIQKRVSIVLTVGEWIYRRNYWTELGETDTRTIGKVDKGRKIQKEKGTKIKKVRGKIKRRESIVLLVGKKNT